MTEFDKLFEEYTKSSRTIKRTERYPKGFNFSREFLDMLEKEYSALFSEVGNRNFHSNFLKALSFEADRFKDNPNLRIAEVEIPEVEIPDVVEELPELPPEV